MKINNKDRLKELIEDYTDAKVLLLESGKENGYSDRGVELSQMNFDMFKNKLNTFLDSVAIVDRRKDS